MTPKDCDDWLDGFAYRELHRTVDRLQGRAGFRRQDRVDLLHDLIGHLLAQRDSFDPARGHRYPFIKVVLARAAARIVRDRKAQKRDYRRVRSLSDIPGDPKEKLSRPSRSPEDLAQMGVDLREVLATLPEDLQELAERLKAQSVSQIARETNIPRTTLQDAARQIRRRFEQSDLQEYF